MNIFRRIWTILHPKEDVLHKPLLGLTPNDLANLRDLRNSDGFEVFTRALDASVNINAELLLNSRDSAVIHETRGFILGLRKAALLVDETIDASKRLADAERDAGERARYAGDASAVSLFGTPGWKRNG